MKTAYIDCGMGAAGDMLTAALLELLPAEERQAFVDEFNALGIPGVEMSIAPSVKCGITGTHVTIKVNGEEEDEHMHEHTHHHEHHHHHDHDHEHCHDHEHEHAHDHHHDHHDHDHDHAHVHEHVHADGTKHSHSHHGTADIAHIVNDHLDLPEAVRKDILAVYGIIAAAESKVHGMPVEEVHFHEVGTMDALADVTAVCMLMNRIAPEQVIASPVNTGSGTVRCAHGILPVPAPATANILIGIPVYSNGIRSELCTPTGAALIKHFATGFGSMPVMTAESIGYGMGKKDFDTANCVRIMLGNSIQGL